MKNIHSLESRLPEKFGRGDHIMLGGGRREKRRERRKKESITSQQDVQPLTVPCRGSIGFVHKTMVQPSAVP